MNEWQYAFMTCIGTTFPVPWQLCKLWHISLHFKIFPVLQLSCYSEYTTQCTKHGSMVSCMQHKIHYSFCHSVSTSSGVWQVSYPTGPDSLFFSVKVWTTPPFPYTFACWNSIVSKPCSHHTIQNFTSMCLLHT